MRSFLLRFGTWINFVLAGFDRLRFRGESRLLNNARGVDSYLFQRQVRDVDFPEHAENLTKQLRSQTEKLAQAEGVPLKPVNSADVNKEALALELARQHQRSSGRVAVISAVEGCLTYRLRKQPNGMVKPVKEPAKCLHYYHCFLHQDFGLCYVRVQSWFPFQIRVGMNGRAWLYRQLEQRGMRFQKHHNLLLSVDNPPLAQQLLDEQRRCDWPTLLDNLVRPVQPLWSYLHDTVQCPYYWMTEQSEWATDFVFRSPEDLTPWYERWVRHGIITLQCKDVMRYLGKKVPNNCKGEVKMDLRDRPEGTRLKFWYETNSIKIYDKEAHAFRIETTINQPQGFKAYRTKEGGSEEAPKDWHPLRKGVADMSRRAEVSDAANQRLAESLASVAETTTLGELLKPLGQRVVENGRRKARALNPLTGADGALLRMLGQGDYLLKGFRNRDLRVAMHGDTPDAALRRRQSAAMTRRLALLRAHGLIVKVTQSHRYHLSAAGRRIITSLVAAQNSDASRLTACA